MLTATRGADTNTPGSFLPAANSTRTTLNDSTTSFAQQLANSLETYLNQTSSGSHLQIDISPQTSLISGSRQFVVTVKDAPVSSASASATPQSNNQNMTGMMMFSGVPSPAPVDTAPQPFTDEADAYWAMQPEEVKVLRTLPNEEERWTVGRQLAQKGFSIDPQIMLYGWDPYMTMKVRKEEGYTWIPALGQGSAMNMPGFNFPGLTPYDAFNPPPGSIKVSTDFANGLESTSPCGRPEHPGNTSTS